VKHRKTVNRIKNTEKQKKTIKNFQKSKKAFFSKPHGTLVYHRSSFLQPQPVSTDSESVHCVVYLFIPHISLIPYYTWRDGQAELT